tara:strand:- start:363 stop:731 length:369 start_codon:yes stop_codon:yes gene_type:complete
MNNSQKFEELKPEIKDFISNKKLEGLPAADIKKEMAKPKKENGFGVSLRTAQRWYLILNDPEVGSFETIQNKKEVNRIGSSFLLDNLERLVLTDNKEEREEIEKEIEIISKSIKGVNQIRSH